MIKRFFHTVAILLALCSCEKVINLPVNDADEILVVEAVLKDTPNSSHVLISKTGTVYDNGSFDLIADATVTVSDDLGNVYNFVSAPLQKGKFILPTFSVQENRNYHLSVIVDGETITADASSRTKPKIDSLTYHLENFGITDAEFEFYLVSYHSVDNATEKNHYRLKISVNEEQSDFYFVGDDEFINGQYYNAQFFGVNTDLGDSIRVELIEMDEHVYDYVLGLASESESNMFSATPSNPLTNLKGNAIGYFGVYMTDVDSLVIL